MNFFNKLASAMQTPGHTQSVYIKHQMPGGNDHEEIDLDSCNPLNLRRQCLRRRRNEIQRINGRSFFLTQEASGDAEGLQQMP